MQGNSLEKTLKTSITKADASSSHTSYDHTHTGLLGLRNDLVTEDLFLKIIYHHHSPRHKSACATYGEHTHLLAIILKH